MGLDSKLKHDMPMAGQVLVKAGLIEVIGAGTHHKRMRGRLAVKPQQFI
jgi:hypothetical protein